MTILGGLSAASQISIVLTYQLIMLQQWLAGQVKLQICRYLRPAGCSAPLHDYNSSSESTKTMRKASLPYCAVQARRCCV